MEEGRVFRAGTYAGNPVACAAVVATMQELAGLDYAPFLMRGDLLRREIEDAYGRAGVALSTVGYGSVFGLWFAPVPPATYREAVALARPDLSLRLHLELRRRHALVMASPYGRLYLSFAHDEPALQMLKDGFAGVARAWPSGG
jgi:glutamate-1-semialdehyde 2,1-aminomutase